MPRRTQTKIIPDSSCRGAASDYLRKQKQLPVCAFAASIVSEKCKTSRFSKIVAVVFLFAAALHLFPINLYCSEKLDKLVDNFVKHNENKKVRKIAVVNILELKTRAHTGTSNILEEELTTKLIQKKNTAGYDVIVKSRIEEILEELKLGYKGFVTAEVLKEFGKISQADALLTGTYREKGRKIILNVQLVDTEKAEGLWAYRAVIPKSEFPEEDFQPAAYNTAEERTSFFTSEQRYYKATRSGEAYWTAAYLNMIPNNASFKKNAGNMGSLYAGIDIASIFRMGVGYGDKNFEPEQGFEFLATYFDFSVSYPYSINPNFLVYGGMGGFFESLTAVRYENRKEVERADFGNNALLLVIGLKLGGEDGLDLSLNQTLGAKYTNYTMLKLSVFWSGK